MAKKINLDEIDESYIIASVKKDKSSIPENPERLLSPSQVKTEEANYETLFIHESDLPPARFGKSVYIRKEYHDRISQIISVIGVNEVSLFGYIDNVLTHHFENFSDDITRSFKKNIIFK